MAYTALRTIASHGNKILSRLSAGVDRADHEGIILFRMWLHQKCFTTRPGRSCLHYSLLFFKTS